MNSKIFALFVSLGIMFFMCCGSTNSSLLPTPLPSHFGSPNSPNDVSRSAQVKSADWIPVPSWLAGTWRARQQTVYSTWSAQGGAAIAKPVIIAIERTSRIGEQRSSDGQIWHYTGAPYVRTIETPLYVERQHLQSIRVLKSSDEDFVMVSSAVVTQFDKQSSELRGVFGEVTTTHYELICDGLIVVTFEILDYDVAKQPVHASVSYCMEKRIKPFAVVNSDHRGNLRHLFRQFIDNERARQ